MVTSCILVNMRICTITTRRLKPIVKLLCLLSIQIQVMVSRHASWPSFLPLKSFDDENELLIFLDGLVTAWGTLMISVTLYFYSARKEGK